MCHLQKSYFQTILIDYKFKQFSFIQILSRQQQVEVKSTSSQVWAKCRQENQE